MSAWHERDEGGLGFAGHSLEGEGRRDRGGSREVGGGGDGVGVGGHWAKPKADLSIANLIEVVDVGLVMEVVVDFHRLRVNVRLESILRQSTRVNSIRTQRGDSRATQTNTEGASCDRGACREEGALWRALYVGVWQRRQREHWQRSYRSDGFNSV